MISPRFYLASMSPRRKELLDQIGAPFTVLPLRSYPPRGPEVDETQREGEAPADYVLRIARDKAELGAKVLSLRGLPLWPVLGADTTVILDGDVLGKPDDPQDAARTLARLSGRTHEVRTAVALSRIRSGFVMTETRVSVTQVTMRAIDPQEIERYCATREPYDKAGGYAIQGVAAIFIERIEGSYSGVMGLPLAETSALLAEAGIPVL